MKKLYIIDLTFSSLISSLTFDFAFEVAATDEKDAKDQAKELLRNSNLNNEDNHVSILSVSVVKVL